MNNRVISFEDLRERGFRVFEKQDEFIKIGHDLNTAAPYVELEITERNNIGTRTLNSFALDRDKAIALIHTLREYLDIEV